MIISRFFPKLTLVIKWLVMGVVERFRSMLFNLRVGGGTVMKGYRELVGRGGVEKVAVRVFIDGEDKRGQMFNVDSSESDFEMMERVRRKVERRGGRIRLTAVNRRGRVVGEPRNYGVGWLRGENGSSDGKSNSS